ncbi:MAG: hypothetical protein K0R17_33 [Rariglobus sp.]|jgi:tetratricopeptide (TPR) repeat protein|nr:hypothetical protein [Rariglobus sp.]
MIRPLHFPLLALLAAAASAQTLYFSDGRVVPMSPAVRITKDAVNIPLELKGAAAGEIGLPVSSLARVDWPRPAELDAADAELKAGRPADALRKLDPILPLQQILAEVPGSWWGQAILLRVAALARLDRELDVSVEIERLRRSPANAPLVPAARIAVATVLAETGKTAQASALLAEIDRSGLRDTDLAGLALVDARLLRAQGRHEDALLACLRVPVLYPAATRDLPAALLLAAECYRSLDEAARADTALRHLVEKFPASAEAVRARALLPNNS